VSQAALQFKKQKKHQQAGAFSAFNPSNRDGLICLFFFDAGYGQEAFGVCAYAFFFFVFLLHYPTDHLQS
jgi:hypothetical protein